MPFLTASSIWRSILASRRRRTPPRQTGQDRRTQATPAQSAPGSKYTEGGTSRPAVIKDGISKPPVVEDDLHYKNGGMGRLARFFIRRRAAGDPYDETV